MSTIHSKERFTEQPKGRSKNMNENNEWVDAGFDCTDFGSAETFEDVLEQVGIDSRQYNDEKLFVWWCEEGRIITADNPITAEHYKTGSTNSKKGYAGRMGITGELQWVAVTTFIIQREAEWVKGVSLNERAYI